MIRRSLSLAPVVGLMWLATGCGLLGPGAVAPIDEEPAATPVVEPEAVAMPGDPTKPPMVADIEARKDVCGVAWAEHAKPEPAITMRCMGEWLSIAYGGSVDFTLDPMAGLSEERALTAAQLNRMADHVRRLCPPATEEPQGCDRAIEYFGRAARARFALFDPVEMASFEPLLGKVLQGESVSTADLGSSDGHPRYTPVTLWRLRNAVFARHGRPFKHPDLQAFFYGDGIVPSPLLPVAIDEAYSDARLTDVDRANLSVIKAAEGS